MSIIEKLKKLLSEVPPKWNQIRNIMDSNTLTKEDLATLAISLADDCFCEYTDALDPEIKGLDADNMCSDYLIEGLSLLLEYGLDPNIVVNEDNVMWNLQWVYAPNVGAGALRLLLENGGDPNHEQSSWGGRLFQNIDYEIDEDVGEVSWYAVIQMWLVLIAYGGYRIEGILPITMKNGNSVEIFKNFENYYFEKNEVLQIFDKETGEEVAYYGYKTK